MLPRYAFALSRRRAMRAQPRCAAATMLRHDIDAAHADGAVMLICAMLRHAPLPDADAADGALMPFFDDTPIALMMIFYDAAARCF